MNTETSTETELTCMHQVCRQWPQRALCVLLFGLGQGLKRAVSRFLLFSVDYQHISFPQHQVGEEVEAVSYTHLTLPTKIGV